jgi:hypothetical protein
MKTARLRYVAGCSGEYPTPAGPQHVEPGDIVEVPDGSVKNMTASGVWETVSPAKADKEER